MNYLKKKLELIYEKAISSNELYVALDAVATLIEIEKDEVLQDKR